MKESQGKSLPQLLDECGCSRPNNLATLRGLNLQASDFARRGLHPRLGGVTLSELSPPGRCTDLTHLHQLTRVMASQSREAVGPGAPSSASSIATDTAPPDATLYDFHVSTSRGKFAATFEGLDGCGKSAQMELLAAVLRRDGLDVVTTREPGGTPTGAKIRSVLLDSKTRSLAPMAELALMFAARAQHIAEVVLPALNAGRWVVCDRFTTLRGLPGRRPPDGQRAHPHHAPGRLRRPHA